MVFSAFLNALQTWISRLAALAGVAVLLIPLIGFRRLDRRARGSTSGRLTAAVRWPFMLVMTVLFLSAGVLLWKPLPISLTPYWYTAALLGGALLYFPAVSLYLWGYKTLGANFGLSSGFAASLYADHELVQTGPFRYVRHPMYLGVILAAAGALLIFRTWAMLIFAPISLGIIFRARREERLLAQAFGEDWQAYKKRVPGWIPNLGKRGASYVG